LLLFLLLLLVLASANLIPQYSYSLFSSHFVLVILFVIAALVVLFVVASSSYFIIVILVVVFSSQNSSCSSHHFTIPLIFRHCSSYYLPFVSLFFFLPFSLVVLLAVCFSHYFHCCFSRFTCASVALFSVQVFHFLVVPLCSSLEISLMIQ